MHLPSFCVQGKKFYQMFLSYFLHLRKLPFRWIGFCPLLPSHCFNHRDTFSVAFTLKFFLCTSIFFSFMAWLPNKSFHKPHSFWWSLLWASFVNGLHVLWRFPPVFEVHPHLHFLLGYIVLLITKDLHFFSLQIEGYKMLSLPFFLYPKDWGQDETILLGLLTWALVSSEILLIFYGRAQLGLPSPANQLKSLERLKGIPWLAWPSWCPTAWRGFSCADFLPLFTLL